MWTFISEVNDTFIPSLDTLVWKEEGIDYGSWDDSVTRKKSIEIVASPVCTFPIPFHCVDCSKQWNSLFSHFLGKFRILTH